MYFVKVFLMDAKHLSATYWSMPISRWCLSVLLRHLIHSAVACFDVHHRVQSHCNVAVWWLQYGVVWDKRSPNGPQQPTRWEVPLSLFRPASPSELLPMQFFCKTSVLWCGFVLPFRMGDRIVRYFCFSLVGFRALCRAGAVLCNPTGVPSEPLGLVSP